MGGADTDRDEIEREGVLADREVERGQQPVPALAALAPSGEQDERSGEPVLGAKAFGVVARRDVDAGAGHDVVGQ